MMKRFVRGVLKCKISRITINSGDTTWDKKGTRRRIHDRGLIVIQLFFGLSCPLVSVERRNNSGDTLMKWDEYGPPRGENREAWNIGKGLFFLSFGNYGEFFCGYLVGISRLLTRKVFSVMFPRIQPFYVRAHNSLNWISALKHGSSRFESFCLQNIGVIAISLNVFFCFWNSCSYWQLVFKSIGPTELISERYHVKHPNTNASKSR